MIAKHTYIDVTECGKRQLCLSAQGILLTDSRRGAAGITTVVAGLTLLTLITTGEQSVDISLAALAL